MPYEFLNQNDYLLAKFTGDCANEAQINLVEDFKKIHAEKPVKYIVFQMMDCQQIGAAILREMSSVYRELKAVNGNVRMVGANEKITQFVKTQGLDRILVNKMSLRGALVDFGLATEKQLDVNFINPFLISTQKVFKIQCFMEAVPQKPFIKKPTDPLLLGDISGIISISSEAFNGTLAISLSEKLFCKIGTAMLGENITVINEGNVDLVGELANIVLGQAKLELNKIGYSIQMALPSCVWGKDHKIKHYGGGVCVVIPYQTSEGLFYTEIMTEQLLNESGKQKAA